MTGWVDRQTAKIGGLWLAAAEYLRDGQPVYQTNANRTLEGPCIVTAQDTTTEGAEAARDRRKPMAEIIFGIGNG